MQIRQHLEYMLTLGLLGLCRCLPKRALAGLFRGFARVMYHGLPSRKKITLRNLEIAFPEKSLKERKKIAKACFINLADSMAFNALAISGHISNDELLASVETDDWPLYEKAAAETDKGILFVSAHIGNFELLPQYAALRVDTKLHAVARESSNPVMEERIITPFRERLGLGVFFKKNALRYIIKAIRRGEHAGLMIDQRLRPGAGGINIPFFGREAPTTPSSAFLQLRYGISVLPAFMIKTGNFRHRLLVMDPIEWQDDGRDMEEQVRDLTKIHQKAIEDIIRKYPEQWFWMHDRWNVNRRKR